MPITLPSRATDEGRESPNPRVKPLSLRRQAAGTIALRAMGGAAVFFLHATLGRRLGAEGYGVFSFSLAVASLLAPVVSLGWPTALTRWVVQYVADRAWDRLRGVITRTYQVTILSAGLGALLLFGMSRVEVFHRTTAAPLAFAACILPLLALSFLCRRAYQGFGYVRASIFADEVALPSVACAGLFLFAAHSVGGVMAVYGTSAFLVAITSCLCVFWLIPRETWKSAPRFETRLWMSTALPMALGGISQIIMNRTDTVMLGAMASMESVGSYSAANRLAYVITFVLGALNAAAAPAIAKAYHQGDIDKLRAIVRRVMLWSTGGALPLFLAMVIFPRFLLGAFGGDFTQAALLLRLLALGQLMNAVTGPVGIALLMIGRERQFATSLSAAAVMNILGNAIAIPIAGAAGAATVTATSVAFLNVWQWLMMNRAIRRSSHVTDLSLQ